MMNKEKNLEELEKIVPNTKRKIGILFKISSVLVLLFLILSNVLIYHNRLYIFKGVCVACSCRYDMGMDNICRTKIKMLD